MLNRYRIIPKYVKGEKDKLPYGLILYLGLSRLNAYGEYLDDENIKKLSASSMLPLEYQNELLGTYASFTGYNINQFNYEKMGELKKRGIFETEVEGRDSNTISAGEDNLMIILTAIYSLKYFADSLKKEFNYLPGILLIDELDATLHPEFQAKILMLFNEICDNYKNLNIIFTSHSISVLQECNYHKNKVIYLLDNISKIESITNPDEITIKASLENKLGRDYYKNNKIPVLMEDKQARDFFNEIIEFFKNEEPYKSLSLNALKHFKLIDSSFSSESLKKLFVESDIDKQNLQMIGILDGDMSDCSSCSNLLISLPGNETPETIAFKTCLTLKDRQDEPKVIALLKKLRIEHQCTIRYIETVIAPKIKEIEIKVTALKENNESTHGLIRQYNKDLHEKYSEIFIEILKFWVRDEQNAKELNYFYKGFRNCFKKVAQYYGLNHNIWSNKDVEETNEESEKVLQ